MKTQQSSLSNPKVWELVGCKPAQPETLGLQDANTSDVHNETGQVYCRKCAKKIRRGASSENLGYHYDSIQADTENKQEYTMHGRRVIYANRTQARRRAAILGDDWTVFQSPISLRFYVARASNLNTRASNTVEASPETSTSLPYKLGGTDDPHFQHEAEALSRTEATCDWYDHLREDGRSDGYGESYSEMNT